MHETNLDQLLQKAQESAGIIPQITLSYAKLIRYHPQYPARSAEIEPVLKAIEQDSYTKGIPVLLRTAESSAREGDRRSAISLLETAECRASAIGQDISDNVASIRALMGR